MLVLGLENFTQRMITVLRPIDKNFSDLCNSMGIIFVKKLREVLAYRT